MRRGTIAVAVLLVLATPAIPANAQDASTLGARIHDDVTAYEGVLANVGCGDQCADVQRASDRLSADVDEQVKHFTNKSNAILRADMRNLMTQVDDAAESCVAQLAQQAKDSSPSDSSAAERLEQESAKIDSTKSAVDTDIQQALEETK